MRTMALAFLLVINAAAAAPEPLASITVEADSVSEGIYMLRARGGNIGVSIGDDGIILIDDQYAPLTPKIRAKLTELAGSEKPVRFVVNTHVHFDHTGGNENLGKAGAVIVAHENVRRRMNTDDFRESFLQGGGENLQKALPVVTFNDRVSFHVNGMTLATRHYPHAHTDGDSVVWFEEANIVHMGDLYFQIGYPFIDTERGGSVDGMIAAIEDVLQKADGSTIIMPGHGSVSDREGLGEYRDMLVTIRDRVRKAQREGKTAEQILTMNLTSDYDERWNWQFIDGGKLVESMLSNTARAH